MASTQPPARGHTPGSPYATLPPKSSAPERSERPPSVPARLRRLPCTGPRPSPPPLAAASSLAALGRADGAASVLHRRATGAAMRGRVDGAREPAPSC